MDDTRVIGFVLLAVGLLVTLYHLWTAWESRHRHLSKKKQNQIVVGVVVGLGIALSSQIFAP